MKRLIRLTAGLALVLGFALPTQAQASYYHSDGCYNLTQGTRCVDNTGTNFNPWIWVESNIYPDWREYVCAGSQTTNDTWRTGSGCNYRSAQNGGVQSRHSSYTASTPNSRAKVWWDSGPSAVAVGYESLRAYAP